MLQSLVAATAGAQVLKLQVGVVNAEGLHRAAAAYSCFKQNAKQMPPRTGQGSQADTQHGAILKERWNRPQSFPRKQESRNRLDDHRSLSSDYLSIPAARPKYPKTSSGESSKASHPIWTRPLHLFQPLLPKKHTWLPPALYKWCEASPFRSFCFIEPENTCTYTVTCKGIQNPRTSWQNGRIPVTTHLPPTCKSLCQAFFAA